MITLLLLFQISNDTTHWNNFAERIAQKIIQEGGEDAIYDLRYIKDSTGKYLIFNKRWIYTTPSGYKIYYRTPVAIKLPDNSPENLPDLILLYLEKKQYTKERLLEFVSIGLGCGIVTLGALVSVIAGMSR